MNIKEEVKTIVKKLLNCNKRKVISLDEENLVLDVLPKEEEKEFRYKEIQSIKISKEEWYNNKKSIIIDEKELILTSIEKTVYISYCEKNGNFNIPPEYVWFTPTIDLNYIFSFKVMGEKVENISLYVIGYNENSKLCMNTIKANEEKIIEFSSEVKSIRLVLKLQGECKIDLINTFIKISSKKKLGEMSFNQYRQLGYDKPREIKDLKIACIFDEFTMQCFEPEVNLITFTPEDWRAVFEFNRPHILMVESAWKGNNGEWKGKITNNIEELLQIIKWCKINTIPTIFWNKEDPVHYNFFINTAKYFDYTFTTSLECVDKYKKDLNSEKVYILPFAAQPKIHNPTELLMGRENKICFAGSYYRNKYQERAKDTKTLIEASLPYGVDIYDRNYDLEIKSYKFPKEYREFIQGSLKGEEIVKANKGYKVVINLNTVKYSATMFARRVFELLASNTPVISNYSLGINKIFNEIVVADDNKGVIEEEIEKLMTDKDYYEEKRIKGLREVLLYHTYENRMAYICYVLGIKIKRKNIKILVISINENEKGRDIIKNAFSKQYFNEGELIFIEENNCYDYSYNLLGNLDEFKFQEYHYITYMSSKDYYGENYLLDLFIATKYSNADIIGKSSIYVEKNGQLMLYNEDNEYIPCHSININTMLIKMESVLELKNNEIVDIFNENLMISKRIVSRLNKYSIDKFSYIKNFTGKYDIKNF